MNKKFLGAIMATAVAGMVLSGQIVKAEDSAAAGKVKCSGVNECKGHAACKGAGNECKGANGCKGKGWIEFTVYPLYSPSTRSPGRGEG